MPRREKTRRYGAREKEHMNALMYNIAVSQIGEQRLDTFIAVSNEVERAKMHGESFSSLHEAYAVLLEEVDELWDITRMKRRDRDPNEIRKELIQIAAMAVKSLESLDNFIGGEV